MLNIKYNVILSPVHQFLNPIHNQETSSKRSLYIDNWGHYTHSLQQQSMWSYLSHWKSTVNHKGTSSYHPQFTSPWGKKQYLILWSRVKWRPIAHRMRCDEKCLFTSYMKHGWLGRRPKDTGLDKFYAASSSIRSLLLCVCVGYSWFQGSWFTLWSKLLFRKCAFTLVSVYSDAGSPVHWMLILNPHHNECLVCKIWRVVAKQSYVRAQCTAASHRVA